MGASYGSIHLKTEDRDLVRDVLIRVAAAGHVKFLAGPALNGWIGIYPSGNGQDPTVSAAIASQFPGSVLHLLVHDDDFFAYLIYREGRLADEYHSRPDYFGAVSELERHRVRGRPSVFANLLPGLHKVAEVARILEAPGMSGATAGRPYDSVFMASQQLERFAAVLGIDNALTCYEYLKGGETAGVKRFRNFVEVPDPSPEQARQRRLRAAIQAEEKRLEKSGVLLATIKRKEPRMVLPDSPHWAKDAAGGFILTWSSVSPRVPPQPRRYSAPWGDEPSLVDLALEWTVCTLKVSPSGNFIAAGHGSGSWYGTVHDLRTGKQLLTIPHTRVVNEVEFSSDETQVVSRSQEGIAITSLVDLERVAFIDLEAGNHFAIHPDGRFLVADVSNFAIAIVDLQAACVVRRLSTARNDMNRWRNTVMRGEGPTGFWPNEMVRDLMFSPDGESLLCAMQEGARVYSWKNVLSAVDELPQPLASAASEIVVSEHSRSQQLYRLAFDAHRRTLLFCGLEGKVKFLRMDSGESGTLLEVPGRPPIVFVELSSDSATMCTVAYESMFERKRKPIVSQIWDYRRLAESALA